MSDQHNGPWPPGTSQYVLALGQSAASTHHLHMMNPVGTATINQTNYKKFKNIFFFFLKKKIIIIILMNPGH